MGSIVVYVATSAQARYAGVAIRRELYYNPALAGRWYSVDVRPDLAPSVEGVDEPLLSDLMATVFEPTSTA